jgi:hypothetical protein
VGFPGYVCVYQGLFEVYESRRALELESVEEGVLLVRHGVARVFFRRMRGHRNTAA